ncbi:MAG: hypothetical protein K6F84_08335, partial [Lachnospiraceae bacterium]|nr:hypothetical protein [Lachnospiraceae bacterium]
KQDAVVIVKCKDKPWGKSYWWGTCDLLPDIEIMGDYSNKFPAENGPGEPVMYTGFSYICKIVEIRISPDGRNKFKVAPFAVSPEDEEAFNNLINSGLRLGSSI